MARNIIKETIESLLKGMSMITLFPQTDYYKPRPVEDYIANAWKKTGDNLRQAIRNVEEQYRNDDRR